MTARRAADLVRALGGVASPEDAERILGDAALRRTISTAWSVEAPAVEMLARILRKSAHGNHGSLALVRELLLEGPACPARDRTRHVLAALHRWCLLHGDLSWFNEVSPVAHSRISLTSANEPETWAAPQRPGRLSASWHETDGVLQVRGGVELQGHQVALLVGNTDGGLELAGPGELVPGSGHAQALLALRGADGPSWVEPLTRRAFAGRAI